MSECPCGCGESTADAAFRPGHEAKLRARFEAMRRARGMWRDRTDLPDLTELRADWGRRIEPVS